MTTLLTLRRWIGAALTLLALALLVWFGGPLLGLGTHRPLDSERSRIVVIAVLLLIWLGGAAWRVGRERRAARQLVTGLSAAAQDGARTAEEAQVLSERFTAALATLREVAPQAISINGGRRGRASGARALYLLPWYVLIGAPGSGKTTSLLNSGLRFPLAAPGERAAALSGIGGTRHCDWWFTDAAVLIDTAGRYTTQDSHAGIDQAAWKTFLGLLRRSRPRQPINGVLVTLSVQDLLSFDFQERQRYAQAVRQRVDELQRELGLAFPIYVLVTKVDLVCGFNEFFATFDAEQRAQVWGMTFDLDLKTRVAEGARSGFDREFPLLTSKLNELLFQRLQDERDAQRRAVLYPFPQQFAALGPLIAEFLDGAFGTSSLHAKAIVRGLYFTSGTQQGAPIDRLLWTLAKALNLAGGPVRAPANVGAAKAFFITRLLNEVVFPEAALAGFNERREATLRRLSWGVLAAAVLLSIGFIGAAGLSYARNVERLAAALPVAQQSRQTLAEVGPPGADDLTQLIDALSALAAVPRAINDPVNDPPWFMRVGLYQGRSVDARVGERYRAALAQGLLPRLALQLERVMTAPQSPPEQVYTALKSYLMLYETQHMAPRWFVSAMSGIWARSQPRPTLDAAVPHLTALAQLTDLQVARFHPRNDAAVTAARARAARVSVVDRAYSVLRSAPTGVATSLRLSDVVGPVGVGVLERASGASLAEPLPTIFTRDGYRLAVRGKVASLVASLAREEVWVMGGHSSGIDLGNGVGDGNGNGNDGDGGTTPIAQIAVEVQRRYFTDFKTTWDGVLMDVRVRKPDDSADALATAQVLAQADSPLRKLVLAADRQTRLSASDTAPADPSLRALEAELDQHFAGLRRLVGDTKSAEMDAAMQALNELVNELVAMRSRTTSGAGLREVPPGLLRARMQAARFAAPVGAAILVLAEFGEREASGGVKKEMQSAVGGAAALCRRALPGRYPFSRDSALDLGVQDFAAVFRSGGELDAFFATHLADFVDKSGRTWRLKAGVNGANGAPAGLARVSDATLRQFQDAEAIRIAFLGGGAAAAVTADIAVVSGGAAEVEITLDYDGAQQKMKAGGSGARVMWPARPGARLMLGSQVLASTEGPWALFRLIDKGTPEPGSGGDKLRLSFATPGGKVVLEVRAASSAFNPFRLREIESFACPRE